MELCVLALAVVLAAPLGPDTDSRVPWSCVNMNAQWWGTLFGCNLPQISYVYYESIGVLPKPIRIEFFRGPPKPVRIASLCIASHRIASPRQGYSNR